MTKCDFGLIKLICAGVYELFEIHRFEALRLLGHFKRTGIVQINQDLFVDVLQGLNVNQCNVFINLVNCGIGRAQFYHLRSRLRDEAAVAGDFEGLNIPFLDGRAGREFAGAGIKRTEALIV